MSRSVAFRSGWVFSLVIGQRKHSLQITGPDGERVMMALSGDEVAFLAAMLSGREVETSAGGSSEPGGGR